MKNYKANNNNCYNGYNNNNSNAINTSKSCNNHPQKSIAVPAANEFLKSIGLPILRNENICMPFTMTPNAMDSLFHQAASIGAFLKPAAILMIVGILLIILSFLIPDQKN